MDTIKEIVEKVFEGISAKTIAEQNNITKTAEKVLENNGILKAKISGIKNNVLSIIVDSSAKLYQANLQKLKILGEIKEACPEIEKINFKIGSG